MRFLIPGPLFEDSFADNVASTLREMGHEVDTLPTSASSVFGRLARAGLERLWGPGPGRADRALLVHAKARRPDAVLALTWDVHPEVLAALGSLCPGRRVLWWADAPANTGRWGLANPEWDLVYVKDAAALPKLRLLGKTAALLPEAMNPKWHRPLASRANDDLVVAGNCYGSRQVLVRRLYRDGVKVAVYGPRPPRWSMPEVTSVHRGRYVTRDEKSRVFGEGLACLNSTHFAEGDSLNCRAFEIAGAGGMQLIEARPAVAACFEPGKEVLTFSSYEELRERIDFVTRAAAEVAAIRAAGAKRALAEHTYAHRLARIVADLRA